MEISNELNAPLLDFDTAKTDNSTSSPPEDEDGSHEQRTAFIIQHTIGALLIFNFATAYYMVEEPDCPVVLAFVILEGPIFFLFTACLYRQTYYDANAKSWILSGLPEIMINLVNVLLVLQYVDEARLVIFVFTLILALFVVIITIKLMLSGTAQRNNDVSNKTETQSSIVYRIV